MAHTKRDALKGSRPLRKHHVFLPSTVVPSSPVPSHINHIPPATVPDTEHTYHVDIDGDGIISSR